MHPVALFAFRRPQHLKQSLEGLQANGVEEIYAFADAARTPAEECEVDAVRSLLRQIDWCKLHLIERTENMGLGASVRNGVSHVLKRHERVLVIEDDIVLRPHALDWLKEATARYAKDPRLMSISLWSNPALVPDTTQAAFFSPRFSCWGWTTDRSSWALNRGTPEEVLNEVTKKRIPVRPWGNDLEKMAQRAERDNIWYAGYALAHFLHKGISVYPSESMVVNTGLDGTGTNSHATPNPTLSLIDKPVSLNDTWPTFGGNCAHSADFRSFFDYPEPNIFDRMRISLGKTKARLFD